MLRFILNILLETIPAIGSRMRPGMRISHWPTALDWELGVGVVQSS